jgi:hypothetical protein
MSHHATVGDGDFGASVFLGRAILKRSGMECDMGARTDAGPVGPVDLPQPARSLHPMLRLFHYRGDFLLYDAKSNFGCVFASDDLGALISFLEGQSFDAAKASRGDANDDHFVALWHQLERLRGLGGSHLVP